MHIRGLAGTGRINIDRNRDFRFRIGLQMTISRGEGCVDGSVTEPEIPRFVRVSVISTDEIERPAGVVVGRVSLPECGFAAVGRDQLVIIVIGGVFRMGGTIPDDLVIPVSAGARIGSGVPFSNLSIGSKRKNVGTRSAPPTGVSQTTPWGSVPGMLTIKGERIVASYGASFV